MKDERIILGIDPGTNVLGYGLILCKGKKIELLKMDVLKLGKIDDHALKLKKIFDTLVSIIDEYHPDELLGKAM